MDYIKLNIVRVYNFKKFGRPNIASRPYVCIVCRCLPHRSAPSTVFKNKHVSPSEPTKEGEAMNTKQTNLQAGVEQCIDSSVRHTKIVKQFLFAEPRIDSVSALVSELQERRRRWVVEKLRYNSVEGNRSITHLTIPAKRAN